MAGLLALVLAWPSADAPPFPRDDIVTSFARAEWAWRASCPVSTIDGGCVERLPAVAAGRVGALPTSCGATPERWQVVPRDPDATAAQASFADVIRRLEASYATALGDPELRAALARARLYEGDALREAALAVRLPPLSGDDVAPRVAAWREARLAAYQRAAAKYAEVAAAGDAATAIAAAARQAQALEDLANDLFGIAIPDSLRTGELAEDKVDAYCDGIVGAAEHWLAAAHDRYATCFAMAVDLHALSSWSKVCERALERLDPARYPARGELLPARDEDASVVGAWFDAGVSALDFRAYEVARQLFARAVDAAPHDYAARVGLGVAQRGTGDLTAAADTYERASADAPARGEALFDLAILDKDFRATTAADLTTARELDITARALFEDSLTRAARSSERDEALEQIHLCDRLVQQIDAFVAGSYSPTH